MNVLLIGGIMDGHKVCWPDTQRKVMSWQKPRKHEAICLKPGYSTDTVAADKADYKLIDWHADGSTMYVAILDGGSAHDTLKKLIDNYEPRGKEIRHALKYIVDHKWVLGFKSFGPLMKWLNEFMEVAEKVLQ